MWWRRRWRRWRLWRMLSEPRLVVDGFLSKMTPTECPSIVDVEVIPFWRRYQNFFQLALSLALSQQTLPLQTNPR